MYELIILSQLMRGSAHGYLIAQIINNVIGPLARASNGRIYPLLARLEEDGLVVAHAEERASGGRVSRAYSLTNTGRERFRELMLDLDSSPREYRELFAYKVTAMDLLTARERLRILEHYVDFCRAHISHLEKEGEDLARHGAEYGHSAVERAQHGSVFQHLLKSWRLELEWARGLRAAEER